MNEYFKSYSIKRVFLIVTSVILLVILLIRLFVIPFFLPEDSSQIPEQINVIYSVLDSLFASLLVTVLIAIFYFWLIEKRGDEKIEFISPISIKDELEKTRLNSEYWNYSGGTGRYTKSVTLPELAQLARSRNSQVSFRILILDPNNEEICENYADYRHGLKSGKNNKWSKELVRRNCLSTILSCAVWKEREPLIDVNIGLKNNYSLFRIDQGTSAVIVTREDHQEPAIVADRGTLLYKFYKDEFHQSFRQAKKIQIPLRFFDFDDLETNKVKNLFESLELDNNLSDADINAIIKLTNEAKNPYG